MPIEILMPALSPTMTEGKLVKWLKKEGDTVTSGTAVAEIETDKATMEIEVADDGVISKILVQEGTEKVPVNTAIAILVQENEKNSNQEKNIYSKETSLVQYGDDNSETDTENNSIFYENKGVSMNEPAFEIENDDIAESDDRVIASPLARKLAKEAGIDIELVEGSGPNGRITKADVEKAIETSKGKLISKELTINENNERGGLSAVPSALPSYRDIPLSGMRKIIAERMTESKQNVPHFYMTIDCNLEALEKMRKELNNKADQLGLNYKLTINDFVVKAVAMAMRKVPAVNVSWNGDSIRMYNAVDVAVAVSTSGGLLTPIIRNADRRRLPDISRAIKALAERARAGKLMPEEYQGGNFTISNLGMYGVKNFAAIVNPPQSCILAVGAAEQRIIVKDGSIALAYMMTCTLSVDHRSVDGAVGAEFLSRFKQIIEEPLVMML